jgi:DNA-directed RNA polymerase subunit RPC12/RpoP
MAIWNKKHGRYYDRFDGVAINCPYCGVKLENYRSRFAEFVCKPCGITISVESHHNEKINMILMSAVIFIPVGIIFVLSLI